MNKAPRNFQRRSLSLDPLDFEASGVKNRHHKFNDSSCLSDKGENFSPVSRCENCTLGGQRLVKIRWHTDGVGAVDRSFSSTHKTHLSCRCLENHFQDTFELRLEERHQAKMITIFEPDGNGHVNVRRPWGSCVGSTGIRSLGFSRAVCRMVQYLGEEKKIDKGQLWGKRWDVVWRILWFAVLKLRVVSSNLLLVGGFCWIHPVEHRQR